MAAQKYYVSVDDMGSTFWHKDVARKVLHRLNGPAVEYKSGPNEWWLNGEEVSQEEHGFRTRPVKELTVAEIEKLLGFAVKVVK